MSSAQILVVLSAAVLGSFVKAITGMGFPLLAVPLATLAVGVEDAVVVFVLPNMISNAVLCIDARGARAQTRDLRRLLVPGVITAFVGTVALVNLPEEPLLVVLVVTIALFLANAVARPDLHLNAEQTHRWSPLVGAAAGVMQGSIGISGPVVAGWYHAYRLSSEAFVYTVTLIFGVTGMVQVAVLAVSGAFSVERLGVSALVLVPALATIPAGRALRGRLAGPGFERAVLVVIAIAGLSILFRLAS